MNPIRPCRPNDLDTMFGIINDAAQAYRGVIPAYRWKDLYMPLPMTTLVHTISPKVLSL